MKKRRHKEDSEAHFVLCCAVMFYCGLVMCEAVRENHTVLAIASLTQTSVAMYAGPCQRLHLRTYTTLFMVVLVPLALQGRRL